MAENAIATTQYGDLKGTIAIDGFDGLPIDSLYSSASIPKGYYPVGIRIHGSHGPSKSLSVKARVLCVDTDQTGKTPDEIRTFGTQSHELHTFEFEAEISLDSILKLIKRYDIVLLSKVTRGTQVKIQEIQD